MRRRSRGVPGGDSPSPCRRPRGPTIRISTEPVCAPSSTDTGARPWCSSRRRSRNSRKPDPKSESTACGRPPICPTFQKGKALFRLGDYAAALESLDASEAQGAIRKRSARKLHRELEQLRVEIEETDRRGGESTLPGSGGRQRGGRAAHRISNGRSRRSAGPRPGLRRDRRLPAPDQREPGRRLAARRRFGDPQGDEDAGTGRGPHRAAAAGEGTPRAVPGSRARASRGGGEAPAGPGRARSSLGADRRQATASPEALRVLEDLEAGGLLAAEEPAAHPTPLLGAGVLCSAPSVTWPARRWSEPGASSWGRPQASQPCRNGSTGFGAKILRARGLPSSSPRAS